MNARARIPIAFPNAPAIGDQFTATSGVTYEWDGTVWIDVIPPPAPYVETDPLSVKLVGDTMTGPLVLPLQAPTLDTQATNKGYVDALAAAVIGIALYIGAADASTADCQCTFTAFSGYPNGPLPPANQFMTGAHLIVARAGTPITGPVAGVTLLAGDWLISDATNWYRLPFSSAANIASAIAVTPAVGGFTNVQAALEGAVLKQGGATAGAMTGGLRFGSTAVTTMNDVTRHLALYGTTFGFNITSGQLNAIVPQANTFTVRCGANQRMSVADGTVGINTSLTCQGSASFSGVATFTNQLTINRGSNQVGIDLYKNNRDANTNCPSIRFRNSKSNSVLAEIRCVQEAQWYAYQDFSRTEFWCGSGIIRRTFYGQNYDLRVPAGNCYADAFTVNSDAVKKTDVAYADEDEAVAAFDKLTPVRYKWKAGEIDNPLSATGKSKEPHRDPDRLNWGFLAQNVESASPDLVYTHKEEGKSYDLAGLVAVMAAKIKSLEARLAANGL